MMKTRCLICKNQCKIIFDNLFDDRFGAPGKYSVYKCNNCGFGRLEPVINHKDISQFYAKYYPLNSITTEQIKADGGSIQPKWLAWLFGTNNTAHWRILPNSTVLDIGSAAGVSLLEIEQLGGKAYGVEPDPNAERIAKKLDLRLFKGLITDNPFPGKKFDFITASQVIEHEPDPIKFMETIIKHLSQNGKIILSFPNADSLYRKIFGKAWINWHVPYHCNFFNKASFIKIAKLTGYKVIKMKTITPNLWTILQMKRFLTKPEEGKNDMSWKAQIKLSRNTAIILKVLINIIMVILIPINRLIDLFNQGDSFIVILEKKHEK